MSSFRESEHKLVKFLYENMIWVGIFVAFAIGIPTGIYIYNEKCKSASEYAWFRMAAIQGTLIEAEKKGVRDDALLDTIYDYNEIITTQSSTDATPWILQQLGNVQYEAKAYDDAIETYSKFIRKYSGHPSVSIARMSLGYTYEEKGMMQEALEQFKAIEEEENSFIKSQRSLNMGRCLEKLGSVELAISAYTEAIELSQGTDAARMAQFRLDELR